MIKGLGGALEFFFFFFAAIMNFFITMLIHEDNREMHGKSIFHVQKQLISAKILSSLPNDLNIHFHSLLHKYIHRS